MRIPPALYFVTAVAAMILLDAWLPGPHWLPRPWTLAGTLPVLAGFALHVVAGRRFREHGTTTEALGDARVLVTVGPYRWSRNPMYLSGVVMLLGLGLLLGSVTPFLVVLLFGGAMSLQFIRREESMLAERFGEDYEAYRGRVRRWM